MKITTADVRQFANLSDKKLKQVLTENKKISPQDIFQKATVLEQDARFSKNILQADKMRDLIDTVNSFKTED